MTSHDPNLPVGEPVGEDEEGGLDFEQVRERVGFALRSPRRRPKLAAAVFLIIGGLGITVSVTMPRTYNAQVKLLVQRNALGQALTNPTFNRPREAETPNKNVGEVILRQDNLVSLAKDIDLVNRYYGSRSAALRLKDSVLGGPRSDEERTQVLVKTLQKRLYVNTDDTTITVVIDWSNAQQAYDVVTRVQENLLDAKYDDEVSVINDAIAILQEHAKTERQNVDAALDDYQKTVEEQRQKLLQGRVLPPAPRPAGGGGGGGGGAVAGGGGGAGTAPRASASTAIDPELLAALAEKRRQIAAIEDERQRELQGLKQQLTQAELTLTPQHPTVQALQQQIQARSVPSAELLQAKAEERELAARVAAMTASPAGSAGPTIPGGGPVRAPGGAPASAPLPSIPPLPRELETDGKTLLAKSKLDGAIRSYEEVAGRIAAANIELDIARSAFKYRYTVVTPAEVPRGPKKPIAMLVGIGSVAAAVFLAILIAALADLMQGRALETWQVRRRLKVDVLGELEAP